MTIAQCKAAKRRIILRYGGASRVRSVADAISEARHASMRQANIHRKPPPIKKG
jgi:hypothetical protein